MEKRPYRISWKSANSGIWYRRKTRYQFILVINQLDAQNFCFTISLFHASICFEHHVLIIRRSKLYCTASGIITPIECFENHVLIIIRSKLYCCIVQPLVSSHAIGVMIPEAVQYNFDLLMMSTWCSKHVEAWNKLIVKQKFRASSWLITKINILRCTVSKTSKKKSTTCHSSWFLRQQSATQTYYKCFLLPFFSIRIVKCGAFQVFFTA